jgi:Uma2 family endonuclease
MTTVEELAIHSAADFENLPEEGLWEAADGRAILLPGNELDHQDIADELSRRLYEALERRGRGRRNTTTNVDIPPHRHEGFRTRVPDLVVYERRPAKRFLVGEPPEIAVEVDRNGKLEDYARAGILECWVVDREQRAVKVYRLNGDRYDLAELAVEEV